MRLKDTETLAVPSDVGAGLRHADAPEADTDPEKQYVHDVDPMLAWYVPAGQEVQASDPVFVW